MHKLYELKNMLCEELEKYGSKGELTAGSLDVIDKLAHAVKNIDKVIEASEEGDYSEAGSSYRRGYSREGGSSYRGSSYARGRGSNARRDSMGRYASTGYSREGGYSRDDGKEDMVMQLEALMEQAPSQKIKQRIQDLMSELDNA